MSTATIFQTTPRIVRGAGSLRDLADEIKRLGGTRVMIVTDGGLIETGIIRKVTEILSNSTIPFEMFEDVDPDPRLQIAVAAKKKIQETKTDLVLGIGGGSPLDIAKVAAILVTNESDIGEFVGIDMIPVPGQPTILVPTTAGTGSEVTPIAILSDHEEKLKKGIVSPYLIPETAVLDPELTISLPKKVTAATGMDALIHAVEAFTSKNAYSLTDTLAGKAMQLVYSNILKVYKDGSDIVARGNMLEGSMLAGMAFANAGVTAVHAFAYPIGAEFHIPHGVATSIMLPPVFEYNIPSNITKFAMISKHFGLDISNNSEIDVAMKGLEAIKNISMELDIPKSLKQFGITEKDIPALAEGVMKVTRLLANNPRVMTQQGAEAIYRKVL